MTLPATNWNFPTAIRFGAGRISELADACRSLGISRPLLVTDPALAKMPFIRAAVAANTQRVFRPKSSVTSSQTRSDRTLMLVSPPMPAVRTTG